MTQNKVDILFQLDSIKWYKNMTQNHVNILFQLDSIKWYKDGREFYRLHPSDGQRREFHTPGVNIDANLTLVSRTHTNTQIHA